jgi:hypothetical protein
MFILFSMNFGNVNGFSWIFKWLNENQNLETDLRVIGPKVAMGRLTNRAAHPAWTSAWPSDARAGLSLALRPRAAEARGQSGHGVGHGDWPADLALWRLGAAPRAPIRGGCRGEPILGSLGPRDTLERRGDGVSFMDRELSGAGRLQQWRSGGLDSASFS